jgi:hypothetical protein
MEHGCLTYAEIHWAIGLIGLLISYRLMAFSPDIVNFMQPLKTFASLMRNVDSEGLQFYLGISQSVSTALYALPRRSPILFKDFQRIFDTF